MTAGAGGGDGPARTSPSASPSEWTVRLGRALRDEGVPCSVSETIAGRAALDRLDLADPLDAYFGLKSVFTSRPEHEEAFDRCFWDLWGTRQERAPADARDDGAPERAADPETASAGGVRGERVVESLRRETGRRSLRADGGEGDEEAERGAAYSPAETLASRSFGSLDRREVRRVDRALDRLTLHLATRRSRRLRPSSRGRRLDLRRSFRSALAHDGELIRLARRRRKVERPRVVVLCDVSGSMERYSRFLVRFLLSAGRERDVETFAFGTRLTRLTGHSRAGRPDDVLDALSERLPQWAGGTRIGECLAEFLELHGRTLLGQETVTVIMSDGLDRGDVERLRHAMRGIQRRSRRVIWLNPLLESDEYRPEARGMKAALPHVDDFAPGHSLEALRRLPSLIRL